MGFLVGSILGGWISDRTVKHYSAKGHNVQLAQDRLTSCLPNLLLVFPAATLVYGWALHKHVGGLAVPIISGFCGGLCLMAAFTTLNTYLGGMYPSIPLLLLLLLLLLSTLTADHESRSGTIPSLSYPCRKIHPSVRFRRGQ